MKHFKKKTIALVLASVVTVVGAFGANNYRNCLTGLEFKNTESGNLNLVVQTKTQYNGSLTPIRRDAQTYIITLPEVASEAQTPDISSVSHNISSVNIRTMPYSNTSKGYTRITIKIAQPSLQLTTSNQVFIPMKKTYENNTQPKPIQKKNNYSKNKTNIAKKAVSTTKRNTNNKLNTAKPADDPFKKTAVSTKPISQVQPIKKNNDNSYLLLVALIIAIATFIIVHGKNKLKEITGNSTSYSNDSDSYTSTRKKIKTINSTINKIDTTYVDKMSMIQKNKYQEPTKVFKHTESDNIIDLDQLYIKQQNLTKENDENEALEDFLSGFSYSDDAYINNENEKTKEEKTQLFNEELYNNIINNHKISFSKRDIECINKLLKSEIEDSTIKNIKDFLISNPIKKERPTKEILDNLITTYYITQDIKFSQEDINTLYKLINIELDSDFITDLRTNPKRTKEIEQEIKNFEKKSKKPTDIIFMNVKDMLPDISDALKKHGKAKIKSEYKPEVVYYKEGYEVDILTLDEALPDLSQEINNDEACNSKPAEKQIYVDNDYQVGLGEIKASENLPDLADAIKNPEKYNKPIQKKEIASEQKLLDNITNVIFKPFYENKNNDANSKSITKEPSTNRKSIKISRQKNKNILKNSNNAQEKNKIETTSLTKCIIDGISYNILSSAKFSENKGCYLAKNSESYTILGFIDEKIIPLKQIKTLKNEQIQAKLQEKKSNDFYRYIIKVGNSKFLIDVTNDDIKFVMDLC